MLRTLHLPQKTSRTMWRPVIRSFSMASPSDVFTTSWHSAAGPVVPKAFQINIVQLRSTKLLILLKCLS